MLVACSALLKTLATLQAAAAVVVTGACPTYVRMTASFPGTVLDFSQTTMGRLDVVGINGLTIQGFKSINAGGAAMNIINSKQILILQPRMISPSTGGIVIQESDTVEVDGAWVTGSGGDGIDIAGSTNVNVHDGACEANVPTSVHPDCVQEWSVAGYPLQHIFVQNMTAIGATQGFDLWDHTDFGATDIYFLNNRGAVQQANCIGVINAHNLVVSGNDCETMPGSDGTAALKITSSPGAVITNNRLGESVVKPLK
jgi:hypothetical protein